MVLFFDGKFDEAVAQLRKVVDLDPKNSVGHWGLGLALEQKGKYADAAVEFQKAIEADGEPDPNFMASLGHVLAVEGKRDAARRLLAQLGEESKKSYVSSYHAAVIHAGLNEKDEAFALLNRAAEERSTLLVDRGKTPGWRRCDRTRDSRRFSIGWGSRGEVRRRLRGGYFSRRTTLTFPLLPPPQ